jgi:hypothetical protein
MLLNVTQGPLRQRRRQPVHSSAAEISKSVMAVTAAQAVRAYTSSHLLKPNGACAMTPNSIDRELKRMDLEAERRDELLDSELDRVTGGTDLGKYITKAVDDALGSSGGGGPPSVWVGCAWVPQRP